MRNLVRRRLKEIFRHVPPSLLPDIDLVISARPSSARASFSELKEEFLRALRKLGLEASDA